MKQEAEAVNVLTGEIVDGRASRCQDLAKSAQRDERAAFEAWIALGQELLEARTEMPSKQEFGAWLARYNHFDVRHKQSISYAINAARFLDFIGMKTADWDGERSIQALDKKYRAKVKEDRKRRELEDRAAAVAQDGDAVDMRHGDFRDALADLADVDAVITDPPYPYEYLPLLDDLASWADKVLRPDGVLAVMMGQSYLPEVYQRLSTGGRPYRWTLSYLTPGGQAVQLWDRKVNTFWKPILLYGVPGEWWIGDVTRSDVNDNDKDHHHWGQSVSGMVELVSRLTSPGALVVDPFAGAGTTGVAAKMIGRRFVGCDIEAEHVETARLRIATTDPQS